MSLLVVKWSEGEVAAVTRKRSHLSPEAFELGEDVTSLAVSTRKPSCCVLSLRIDKELLAMLDSEAKAEDRTLSYIAKRALRRGLTQFNAKQQQETRGTPAVHWQ